MRRPRPHVRPLESLETRTVPATLTVAPVVVSEPTTLDVTYVATLDAASSTPITLSYATVNGSARAGRDFVGTRSSITIPAGATSATFTVPLLNVDVAGPSAAFSVRLGVTRGNTVTRRVSTVLVHDVATPTVTASDVVITPNSSRAYTTGTTTLTLSNPTSVPVRIAYQTVPVTAVGSGRSRDYLTAHSIVTIRPYATSVQVPVRVARTLTAGADKVFNVALTRASNAALTTLNPSGEFGRVVILNSQTTTRPTLTVSDATASAGSTETFTVTLSAASAYDVNFRYATQTGTATASQFTPLNRILTIPAGETSATITVPTSSTTFSGSEQFTLNLTAAANATLLTTSATGTIVGTAAPVTGTTLSSNLANTSAGTESASGSTWLAGSFTTSTTAASLTSATLLLAEAATGTATVAIYTDAGLQPGTLVGTLTSPTSTSSSLANDEFTSSGIALSANTTYWVVLKANSGTFNWSYTTNNTGTGSGFTHTWATSADAGSTWFSYDIYPTQYAVVA